MASRRKRAALLALHILMKIQGKRRNRKCWTTNGLVGAHYNVHIVIYWTNLTRQVIKTRLFTLDKGSRRRIVTLLLKFVGKPRHTHLNIKSGNIDTAFSANWVTIDEIIVVGYLTTVFIGVVSAGTWVGKHQLQLKWPKYSEIEFVSTFRRVLVTSVSSTSAHWLILFGSAGGRLAFNNFTSSFKHL